MYLHVVVLLDISCSLADVMDQISIKEQLSTVVYILIVCWCSFSTLNRSSGDDDTVVELLTTAASDSAIVASVDTAVVIKITTSHDNT